MYIWKYIANSDGSMYHLQAIIHQFTETKGQRFLTVLLEYLCMVTVLLKCFGGFKGTVLRDSTMLQRSII